MKAPYPQQARRHMSTLIEVSKQVAAALIEWSHHPASAPRHPIPWCPTMDSKLATDAEKDSHDAEDCKWCPDERPRVRTARTQISKPVEGPVAAGHHTVEQITDVLDAQMMELLSHRHRVYRDEWWPRTINGSVSTTFAGDVVQARNAMLRAAGDIVGHVERVSTECPITDRRRHPDAYDGWMDEHCRHHVIAIGDVVHELRRLCRMWAIVDNEQPVRRCACGCRRTAPPPGKGATRSACLKRSARALAG